MTSEELQHDLIRIDTAIRIIRNTTTHPEIVQAMNNIDTEILIIIGKNARSAYDKPQ